MKPYYTVTEVAEREGLSTRRVRILCEEGRVHYCDKVGGMWFIQLNYRLDIKPNGRPRNPPRPTRRQKS